MQPLPPAKGPMQELSMDFVIGLPLALDSANRVRDAILTVVDRYTKYVFYFVVLTNIDAPRLVELLVDRIFAVYGTPIRIVSDRGSLFTSNF